eukprot:361200-Chlamydomonas_euryale.AAC.21
MVLDCTRLTCTYGMYTKRPRARNEAVEPDTCTRKNAFESRLEMQTSKQCARTRRNSSSASPRGDGKRAAVYPCGMGHTPF